MCYNSIMVKIFGKLAQKRQRRDESRVAMPAILRVLISTFFLISLAAIYTWFIFWRQNLNDSAVVDQFIEQKPELFIYSYIIIALLMLLVAAVTWRPFLTAGVFFGIISGVMYAHIQKYTIRQIPLLPEDFQMAGQLGGMTEFIDMQQVVRLVIGIVLIIVGSALAEHFARKIFGRNTADMPWWERCSLVPRATFTAVVLTILVLISGPIVRDKTQGADSVKWLKGLNLVGWNQDENYYNNGFVIGFLYNIGSLRIEEPKGYNEERVAQILEKYDQVRQADTTERKPLSDIVDNLILVMNESFYDPEILGKDYEHGGGDVVPNLHKVFQKYPSGYMYSPEYGGNTANVEFAAYTSLTNYWTGSIPYVTSVSKINNMPGMARFAKDNGLLTTAIHSYDGTMYKRNFVYANMGFADFIEARDMTHTKRENGQGYISDSEIYQEIIDILNNGEKKHMVGAVTMQNHAPFNSPGYDTLHFPIKKQDLKARYNAELSFESLHNSDKYLGDFIRELDKLEGKTVMIWFGDHATGVLDEMVSSGEKDQINLTHLTPYFIYANFDLENTFTEKEVAKLNREIGFSFKTKGVNLSTVTPNCLANILYDVLGAEKPALLYLVDKVCEETPILAPSYFADEEPEMTDVLKEYQIINYDILNGKRYSLK